MASAFLGVWILAILIYLTVLYCCKCFFLCRREARGSSEPSRQRREDIQKTRLEQTFNPADILCDDPARDNVPFDEDSMPMLYCAEFQEKTWTWKPVRDNKANKMPKSQKSLFKPFTEAYWQRKASAMRKDTDIKATSKNWAKEADKLAQETRKDQERLMRIKTGDLEAWAQQGDWRCVSHLHAPEPLPNTAAVGPSTYNENATHQNLHTFVRDVGHTVDLTKRDSRFLARLRMGICKEKQEQLQALMLEEQELLNKTVSGSTAEEKARKLVVEEELKKLETMQRSCVNFLVIKFKHAGTITWVSPEVQHMWNRPGEIIFLVKLEDGGAEMPVFVPNFDLRFSFETCWRPVKSLTASAKDLEKKLLVQRGAKGQKTGIPVISLRKRSDQKEIEPDGYSRPIQVTKNAFLCRIQKDSRSLAFDRPQSKNWWRTVLQPTFPELKEIEEPLLESDTKMIRCWFLSRFMNLRQNMTCGHDHKGIGMIKGHVRISQIKPEDVELEKRSNPKQVIKSGIRPTENLWIEAPIQVNVCVLTARDLRLQGYGDTNLYIKADIKGADKEARDSKAQLQVASESKNQVNFYFPFHMFTRIPKATILRLELWAEGSVLTLGQDRLLGFCEVDLEDRWMALQQMKLRETSSEEYIKYNTSPWKLNEPAPGKVFYNVVESNPDAPRYWEVEEEDIDVIRQVVDIDAPPPESNTKQDEIYPRMVPPQPLPIETHQLKYIDEDTKETSSVGNLRFWVDLMPEGATGMETRIASATKDFELRIKVEDLSGINVFTDFGERNDVVIKGILEFRTPLNTKAEFISKKTDTHQFARSFADFQWMWKFPVQAPATMMQLHLYVKNENRVMADEALYAKEVVPLDTLLMLAYDHEVDGKDALPMYTQEVIFDAPSKSVQKTLEAARRVMPMARCRNCGFRPPPVKVDPATLKLTIQIVPVREANVDPVEEGRPETMVPMNRVQWPQILMQPLEAAEVLVGQSNLWVLRTVCLYSACIMVLFFTLAVFYLIGANIHPIIAASS